MRFLDYKTQWNVYWYNYKGPVSTTEGPGDATGEYYCEQGQDPALQIKLYKNQKTVWIHPADVSPERTPR